MSTASTPSWQFSRSDAHTAVVMLIVTHLWGILKLAGDKQTQVFIPHITGTTYTTWFPRHVSTSYHAHESFDINFRFQCGIDLVNEEARAAKQGSWSKEGTAPRKKRESRVQSFGWNQVRSMHPWYWRYTSFPPSSSSSQCACIHGCFPSGSDATIYGPERGSSAKKRRRSRRLFAHGRKRREPFRARHGGSFRCNIGAPKLLPLCTSTTRYPRETDSD